MEKEENATEHQKNLSFIQFLCHFYSWNLQELHLKCHSHFEDVNQLLELILLRLNEITLQAQEKFKKGASMILELSMNMIIEHVNNPEFDEETITN